MPNTKHPVGYSTKRTTNVSSPITKTGTVDKRYTTQQFCKTDGTRDKRTNLISKTR